MDEQKQAVADCMNRLYDRGLTTVFGGNISLRVSADLILLTPSGTDKGNISAGEIAEIGMDGTNHTPNLKPSGETSMHLEIYKRRPDVHAVIHAHPTFASMFTALDRKLSVRLLAEAYMFVGDPAFAPYALTGTKELAENVADALGKNAKAVLMENHGVLTVGKNLLQAFDRIEVLESAAKMNAFAATLGAAKKLTDAQCAELDRWVEQND